MKLYAVFGEYDAAVAVDDVAQPRKSCPERVGSVEDNVRLLDVDESVDDWVDGAPEPPLASYVILYPYVVDDDSLYCANIVSAADGE